MRNHLHKITHKESTRMLRHNARHNGDLSIAEREREPMLKMHRAGPEPAESAVASVFFPISLLFLP